MSKRVFLPFLLFVSMLSAWEVLAIYFEMPRYILPKPTLIFRTLIQERTLLFKHTIVTLQEMLIGFSVASVIAITLAILMFRFELIEQLFYPFIIASQTVPVFAIAPLLVVWFGYGITSKIVMTALIVFFPMTLNTLDGFRSADPDIVDLFRVFGANWRQTLWKVHFPSALPFIFSGAKISVSISTIGAVIGEWVGAKAGLGFLMLYANSQMRTEIVFASICCLTATGFLLFSIATLFERFSIAWKNLE